MLSPLTICNRYVKQIILNEFYKIKQTLRLAKGFAALDETLALALRQFLIHEISCDYRYHYSENKDQMQAPKEDLRKIYG